MSDLDCNPVTSKQLHTGMSSGPKVVLRSSG